MLLIVGLGNPGKKYQNTRHNIGFLVIDEFRKRNDFPKFKLSKKFNALISGDVFNNEKKIILAKPQTFMNESGKTVKKLISSFLPAHKAGRFPVSSLIVIHDDIDLPLGKIRISKARGSAGHKGVESIIKTLTTKNFIRVRVGIQPKGGKSKNLEKSEHIPYVLDRAQKDFVRWFVLQEFNREEEKILKEVIKKASQALKIILIQGSEKTMAEFNI